MSASKAKGLAGAFGLTKTSPPHKITLIYYDEVAGVVKARFEMKETGEEFTRDEADLVLRIQNGKRTGLDVRVEETALWLLRRMTELIKEGYYKL